MPRPGWRSHTGQWVSEPALQRLAGLQQVIRRLRSLTGLPLTDLVGEAERALGLDIEVLSRPGYTPAAARAHLDAFADVAAGFTASADRPNLGGFLSWLEAALKEERGLDKGYIEASPDAVQILTVHAAKGLEWDAVAVPGLVEGSFPALNYARSTHDGTEWVVAAPKDRGWCGGLSGVPYDLRGDRDGLPVWEWRSAEDWADVGRLDALRAEREALVAELAGATGLGGAPRTTGATVERARVAVRKAIVSALSRIEEVDQALGRHLRDRVRTGSACRYEPDPDRVVEWEL